MNAAKEISKSNIVTEVMRVIKSARREILATMDLSEEIKRPLPRAYFLLLKRKVDHGIRIKRLAFGTKADFMRIQNRHVTSHKNYQMRLATTEKYRRMLLIDKRFLFFEKGKQKQRFFFSSDPSLIKSFSSYFKRSFKS